MNIKFLINDPDHEPDKVRLSLEAPPFYVSFTLTYEDVRSIADHDVEQDFFLHLWVREAQFGIIGKAPSFVWTLKDWVDRRDGVVPPEEDESGAVE